jgi:hypothetical protein
MKICQCRVTYNAEHEGWLYAIFVSKNAVVQNTNAYSTKSNAVRAALVMAENLGLFINGV